MPNPIRTKEAILTEIEQVRQRKIQLQEKWNDQKKKHDQREKEQTDQIKNNMAQKRKKTDMQYEDAIQQCDSHIEKLQTKWKTVLERGN